MSVPRASRAAFVAALAAPVVVPTVLRAAEPLAVGITAVDASAPPFYAQELGYFKDAGLDVRLQYLGSGPALAAALGGGAIEIGSVNTGSLASARLRGLGLRAIVPTAIVPPGPEGDQLLVARTSTIRTGADLNGKTIATNALATAQHAAAMGWIDLHGGDAKTAKFVEMPIPAMGAALEAGRVDAGITSEPFTTQALVANRSLGPLYEALHRPFMIFAMCATDQWLQTNADRAAAFVSVIRRANVWSNVPANDGLRRQFNQTLTKVDPQLIAKMLLQPMGTTLAAGQIQPVIDIMVKYGFLAAAVNPNDMMWRP